MNYEQQRAVVKDIIIHTPAPYKSLKWNLVPDVNDPGQQAWLLVFYLNNFAEHTQSQQTSIVEWAQVLLTKINGMGVPCGVTRVREKNEV